MTDSELVTENIFRPSVKLYIVDMEFRLAKV